MTGQYPKHRPTGTVGVIGMDTGRFSEFSLALGRLELPRGWEIMGALNYDEAHARNFLAEHFTGDYLFFIDDDHAFAPDTLERLLEYRLSVVAPLVCQRRPPFLPVAIKDGGHLQLERYEEQGLIDVELTGTAGMLIRRGVFDRLERPYFEHRDLPDGTHEPSDTNFCRKLGEVGVAIHVALGVSLTHFNAMGVTPRYEDGRWLTSFSVGNVECFQITRSPVVLA